MPYNICVVSPLLDEEQKQRILDAAKQAGDSKVTFYASKEEAAENAADADIIYSAATGGGHKIALAAKNLKWFCSISAGVDALLKPGVLSDDCLLTNASGAYGLTISEHMIMVTLMLLRRYPEYDEIVRRHEFTNNLQLRSIKDSTFVILGTGDIGTHYADRLRAFEPKKIIGVNRSGKRHSDVYDEIVTQDKVESVLPEADVVAMCLPGTPETDNMMSKERLAMLPKTAFVINVGRGNALDQDALCDALNEGRLAGAAIDVFKKEPLDPKDPLWDAKNILITPHCSGKMTLKYTRDKNVDMFCEDLLNFAAGRPLAHLVSRKLGY